MLVYSTHSDDTNEKEFQMQLICHFFFNSVTDLFLANGYLEFSSPPEL